MVIVLVLGCAGAGLGALPVTEGPLPEATVLGSVDGRLVHSDANDAWWFELTADIQTDGRRVPAGRRFRMLPCALLEQLITDVNDRYTPLYRLWVCVTRYEGTNYLLPTYFLPLSKFKGDEGTQDAGPTAQDARKGPEPGLQPSDPELAIPPEIVEKLKNRRPLRGPLRKPSDDRAVERPDRPLSRMLANLVGLIEEDVGALKRTSVEALADAGIDASTLPRFHFVPYALGWNVSTARYELLPCSVLERVRQMQRSSIEPLRFNVAGLVTEFGGKQYLLLQRATPVYNYGNFGR